MSEGLKSDLCNQKDGETWAEKIKDAAFFLPSSVRQTRLVVNGQSSIYFLFFFFLDASYTRS